MDRASDGSIDSAISARSGLLALAFVTVAAELGYSVVNLSALQPYIKEIGLVKIVGLVYAAFLLSEALLKSPLGAVGDRIGRRRLVVGGLLLSACCEAVIGFTHSWRGIIGIRILDGIGAAAVWPSVYALAGDCTPTEHRGGAMGLINTVYIAAMTAGPALGGVLNDAMDSRTSSFLLAAVLLALAAVVVRWVLPARWGHAEVHHEHHESVIGHLWSGVRLVPDLMPMAFAAFTGTGLLTPVVKLFSMDDLGMSETRFGLVLIAAAIVVVAASVPLGKLGDRIGRPRMVRFGMGIVMVALWGIALSRNTWAIVALASLLGIGFMATIPAWLAIVVSRGTGRHRGAAVGVVGAAQGLGMVLGTAIGGWLFASVSHRAPFFASAVAVTVAFLLTLMLKEHRPGPPRTAGANEAPIRPGLFTKHA